MIPTEVSSWSASGSCSNRLGLEAQNGHDSLCTNAVFVALPWAAV
jgi:hypothetical protein